MVEFALNSAMNGTTGFAPFELNYGTMPLIFREVPKSHFNGVCEFAQRALHNLAAAHDAIIAGRTRQTVQANKHCRDEVPYSPGDLVYLSTKNLALPAGRAHKLLPKFIGPFKILEANPETSNYLLELPPELANQRIHPQFHSSLLRPHEANDDLYFPAREPKKFFDFGMPEETEWLVEEIIGHQWEGSKISFQVRWAVGDTTWEPYAHCKDLAALDSYLALRGVKKWQQLPKRASATSQ